MRLQKCTSADCASVAIINAYKYKNGIYPDISASRLGSLYLETDSNYGTEPWIIPKNPLINVGKRRYDKTAILSMNAFIMLYSINAKECHYVFVSRDNNVFTVYNYYSDIYGKYLKQTFDKETFSYMFFKQFDMIDGLDYPMAWKIELI